MALAQSDTLQVLIGNSSELLFIAKDPSAYEDLKKYDFNKMLLEMQAKLNDSQTKKAFLKDNSGEKYLQKKRKYLSGYYMNYYLGFNYSEGYEILNANLVANLLRNYTGNQLDSYFQTSYPENTYSVKVFQSPYLAASVNRHFELYANAKTTVILKGGLEGFFSFEKFGKERNSDASSVLLKSSSPAGMENSVSFAPDTLASGAFEGNSDYILWKYADEDSYTQSFTTVPYNVVKAGFNVKIIPAITFNNRSNKRVVSLGFGPTIGINVIGNSITKIKDNVPSAPVVVGGVKATPLRYGLVCELGIGGVTFFGQYVKNKVKNRELEVMSASSGVTSQFTARNEYMTEVITFGLKFGK
ncbi:hypothetical protein DJ013_05290 [Arcticibacterium luteifluviistationis]|uniref:Uncharacterized protein n=1 Tax=Arcticibacterium luteifluviistationis TaxID=1784714 RepID=A0A2Z4G976_9BACT|nr:hypothetical protein DJ013_05290 [Arcticibacterium luteifluviistationis]